MKVALIGASSESLHSIKIAKKLGITVVALDGNPQAEGLKIADKSLVVNIADEKATIDAVENENVDFLITVPIGRYLTTIGAVNDFYHLKGVTKAVTTLCTDKLKFHEQLEKDNLRQCDCFLINREVVEKEKKESLALERKEKGYSKIAFPAILKPRYGSGSRAIYFLNQPEDLKKAIEEVSEMDEDFILENAVTGVEYGVDGAVVNGEFQLILLRKKINTPPPARQAVGYLVQLPEENMEMYDSVKTQLQKIVNILEMKDCLLHADLMIQEVEGERCKKNNVFPIELSARPSGHYLHNIFTPVATGVDMAEEYMKYMCGEVFSFVPKSHRKIMIHFFDLENCKIEKIPREQDLNLPSGCNLLDWQCNMKVGEYLEPISGGHSLMGRGYFILEGKNNEVLEASGKLILQQIKTI